MSKIICDICGTSYPETADVCPICGCARDEAAKLLGLEPEEMVTEKAPKRKSERASSDSKRKTPAKKNEDLFDEDLLEEELQKPKAKAAPAEDEDLSMFYVDDDEDDEDDDYEDDDDEDEDDEDEDNGEEGKSNAPLVVMLVIVILALIAVSSFIIIRYFIPYYINQETEPPVTTTAPVTESPETTELKIPCESLALTSGGEVVLEDVGANWLINVMALPENTTDKLTYASSDESVVTVDEQGKVTAVGEGTAVITITCGTQQMTCTITCDFIEETSEPTVPETTVPEEPTVPETTVPETTAPEEEKERNGVITAKSLNIRETPDANGKVVGVYGKGAKVVILEQKVVDGTTWGRTNKGWISMKYVELED